MTAATQSREQQSNLFLKGEEMSKFFDKDDIRFFRIVAFTAVVVVSIVTFVI